MHVKGSLAGAYGDKRGKLEQANGGTIFRHDFGEIDAVDAVVAAPLFGKRGSASGRVRHPARRVDARVVAATDRDLDA